MYFTYIHWSGGEFGVGQVSSVEEESAVRGGSSIAFVNDDKARWYNAAQTSFACFNVKKTFPFTLNGELRHDW